MKTLKEKIYQLSAGSCLNCNGTSIIRESDNEGFSKNIKCPHCNQGIVDKNIETLAEGIYDLIKLAERFPIEV